MSVFGLTYHAGQRALERNISISLKQVQKLKKQRKAFLVPAKYGNIGIYIPDMNLIVILNPSNTRILSVTPPSRYYTSLIDQAKEILKNPKRVIEAKDKNIYYSENGLGVITTKSGKTILKIKKSHSN